MENIRILKYKNHQIQKYSNNTVSYTHLDVYKRQRLERLQTIAIWNIVNLISDNRMWRCRKIVEFPSADKAIILTSKIVE